MRGFGVGCFMFEAPGEDFPSYGNPNGAYTMSRWAEDVRSALEAIPSVDGIEIEAPSRVHDHGANRFALEPDDEWSGTEHYGGSFMPHPSRGRITFCVTIPLHIPNKIVPFVHDYSSTVFTGGLRFDGMFPIAFVSMDQEEKRPALAVEIVRDFLTAEFEQRAGAVGNIRFSHMDLTYLNANCWVNAELSDFGFDLGSITAKHVRNQLHDDVIFEVLGRSEDEAFESVKREVVHELGLYCYIVSERNLLSVENYRIDRKLQRLIALQKRRGAGAWFRRLTSSGRDSLALQLQFLHLQMESASFYEAMDDTLDAHYRDHRLVAFRDWIEEEIKRGTTDRRSNVGEMVALLNTSHSRSVQGVTVVAASIGGGLAGAALAALAAAGGA